MLNTTPLFSLVIYVMKFELLNDKTQVRCGKNKLKCINFYRFALALADLESPQKCIRILAQWYGTITLCYFSLNTVHLANWLVKTFHYSFISTTWDCPFYIIISSLQFNSSKFDGLAKIKLQWKLANLQYTSMSPASYCVLRITFVYIDMFPPE